MGCHQLARRDISPPDCIPLFFQSPADHLTILGVVDILDGVDALDFEQARSSVLSNVLTPVPVIEHIPLSNAAGRVLAAHILADRDYPPSDRSIRDGFAVRSLDMPGSSRIVGEVRAGGRFVRPIEPGECVRIMTGATVPEGADAVVMVEHTRTEGSTMTTDRSPSPGEFINRTGCEAHAGDPVLSPGVRIRFPHIAMLATVGAVTVPVFRKPRVAILATGDELVAVESTPREFEVRNSNSWALASQVEAAGGVPEVLPVAPDDLEATVSLIAKGLQSDLLLLSGGVSAGEYDYVEAALAHFEAQFFFTRVRIRPGAPAVFGHAQGKNFFGLPGNPLSTAVTFDLFARPALEMLSGIQSPMLPLSYARTTQTLREKGGLTRFLPASLDSGTGNVTPIPWKGSSDVPSLAKSNCYIVAEPDRELYEAGDVVPVLIQQ